MLTGGAAELETLFIAAVGGAGDCSMNTLRSTARNFQHKITAKNNKY
jgi:hypothetical protein